MKTLKTLMVVMLVLLVTFLLEQPANAQGRGGSHGGGHGGGQGGGGRGHYGGHAHGYGHGYYGGYGYGWWGYPYWWGSPYYPYYDPYYYEGYGGLPVLPQEVTPPAESGQQQPSYWHFCQDPEGYYPYVKDCPGGWMTVVPPKPNAPPPSKLGAPVLPVLPPDKKSEK
jgi:hypothetical protein